MLIRKFEEQVEKTPLHIAVNTCQKTFTYRELNSFANAIANHLLESGTGEITGLLFTHGVNMIAAILGALKAGNVYVPLSVDYPPERLSYMLADSQASIILTDKANRSLAQTLAGKNQIPLLGIDSDDLNIRANEKNNPSRSIKTDQPAYILYTSGSTGKPKGVVQTHENADYYNRNWVKIFSLTGTDRMTLFSSFCHDGSVQDMYSAFYSGATLYPFNMRNPDIEIELSEFLIREKITIWHSVPSLFSSFANTLNGKEPFPHLRFILLGGEPVREHEVRMLNTYFPHSTLANIYGQTESSVNAIHMIPYGSEYKKSLLGTPLEQTQLLVIDEDGDPVEPLGIGEILVVNPFVSPGYWKNPDATSDAFGQDDELGNFYWTGDLGRLLLDGNIEFLGRRDFQVKIRGFRVELGEIESRLLEHPGVNDAIVTMGQDNTGDSYLCAYITVDEKNNSYGQEGDVAGKLREFLIALLPDYMIPSYFVVLDTMPRTPNGKIDRMALPLPETSLKKHTYAAPSNPIEKKLLELWMEVLGFNSDNSSTGFPAIDIESNFFLSGGNSLKAVRLVSKIQRQFKQPFPLGKLFQIPTIKGIAHYLQSGSQETGGVPEPISAIEKKEYYQLSINQERLWYLHQLNPDSVSFNMIYRVELDYPVEVTVVKQVLARMIERHESLRTSIREGDHFPWQCVGSVETGFDIPLREIDLSFAEKEKQPEEAAAVYRQAASTPFVLDQPPLFRTILIKLADAQYHFIFILHHIISDGWSMELLRQEFSERYRDISNGTNNQNSPLYLQYKDFAQWQKRQVMDQPFKDAAGGFWKEILQGMPALQLPHLSMEFNSDSPDQGKNGAGYICMLDESTTEKSREFAKSKGVTLFSIMYAIYLLWLYRFSQQEDIGCSIIHAGREHDGLQDIVGFFVNSLPFRIQIQSQEPFNLFLDRVQEQVINAFQYQSYPPEIACEDLGIRFPKINVSFNMLNMSSTEHIQSPVLPANPHIEEAGEVKFDIEPYIREYTDRIQVYWVYRTSMFEPGTFEYMAAEYIKLVDYFCNLVNKAKSFSDYRASGQQRTFRRNE